MSPSLYNTGLKFYAFPIFPTPRLISWNSAAGLEKVAVTQEIGGIILCVPPLLHSLSGNLELVEVPFRKLRIRSIGCSTVIIPAAVFDSFCEPTLSDYYFITEFELS